jgi:hypothetical protein
MLSTILVHLGLRAAPTPVRTYVAVSSVVGALRRCDGEAHESARRQHAAPKVGRNEQPPQRPWASRRD